MFFTHHLRFFKTEADQLAGDALHGMKIDLSGLLTAESSRRADLHAVLRAWELLGEGFPSFFSCEVSTVDLSGGDVLCGQVTRRDGDLIREYFG